MISDFFPTASCLFFFRSFVRSVCLFSPALLRWGRMCNGFCIQSPHSIHADFYYNDRFHISSSVELKSCILNRYLLNMKHTGPGLSDSSQKATTLQMAEITWKCSGYSFCVIFLHNHQNRRKTNKNPSIENIF